MILFDYLYLNSMLNLIKKVKINLVSQECDTDFKNKNKLRALLCSSKKIQFVLITSSILSFSEIFSAASLCKEKIHY